MLGKQLRVLGMESTGFVNGLPSFPGVFLREIDGKLRVFKDKECKPWEQPEEDPDWSAEDLAKIKAVIDRDYGALSDEEQACVTAVLETEQDEQRRKAYEAKSDHLFFEWQAVMAEDGRPHDDLKQAWLSTRQAVKSQFPNS
jgi:hypothetical protein